MKEIEELQKSSRDEGVQTVCPGGLINTSKGVLILRRKYSDSFWPGLWELPSGKLVNNEDLIDGLKREVKEETGLDVIAIVRYVGYFDYRLKDDRRARKFVWQVETNPGKIILTEHCEYRFVQRLSDLGKDDLSPGIESILTKFFMV